MNLPITAWIHIRKKRMIQDPYKVDPRFQMAEEKQKILKQEIYDELEKFKPNEALLQNKHLKDNILIKSATKQLESIMKYKSEIFTKSPQNANDKKDLDLKMQTDYKERQAF